MGSVSHGMLDPGNVINSAGYYAAGRNSVTVPVAGSRLATLVNFGRINPTDGVLVQAPARITRATLFFAGVSGLASSAAFELVKGTATVQDNANGSERAVVPRKRTGYPSVGTTEISLYMSTAGTAVSGGNFSAVGEPFLLVGAGSAAAFGAGWATWEPADLVPITLEAGEACALQVTAQGGAAVGILGVVFDILRQ